MDIKKEPFETLALVEVAMSNDNNELRKIVTNFKKREYDITEDKINMQVLSIRSIKTNDVINIGNVDIKYFTANLIRLENYQEAFKYIGIDVTNRNSESRHFIVIKLET